MAVMKGKSADIQWAANDVEQCQDWSLSVDPGLLEDTEFGDDWVTHVSGVRSWSGSMKGNFDNADTNGHATMRVAALAGTSAALKLEIDGSNYFTGTAFIQMSLSVNNKGVLEATYSFTGTGALTYG